MLTRKVFKKVAQEVCQIKDVSERTKIAQVLGKVFAEDNPNFVLDRFLQACGVPTYGGCKEGGSCRHADCSIER